MCYTQVSGKLIYRRRNPWLLGAQASTEEIKYALIFAGDYLPAAHPQINEPAPSVKESGAYETIIL